MRRLQILMPMAGLGSRFANAGFTLPKPLIEVDGLPMFRVALSSLDNIKAEKNYYFVILQEHVDVQGLDVLIKTALPEANVIVIPKVTRGAAETAYMAKFALNPLDALIIMDCDLWFQSKSFGQTIEDSLNHISNIGGSLLTFESNNPRYSYAKIGADGYATATAEKNVISNNAITGAYFFSSARIFIDAASLLLSSTTDDKMPEYYLSLLYNILIDEGHKIQTAKVDKYASFGTPEELENYRHNKNNSKS